MGSGDLVGGGRRSVKWAKEVDIVIIGLIAAAYMV